jgi:hypothetical protein
MSWSVSFKKPVEREFVNAAIDGMEPPQTGGDASPPIEYHAALSQFEQAKVVAKELVKIIPGRYVMVSMNGHANGVGWQKKPGYANDCVNVNICQMTEEDLQQLYG